MRRLRVIPIARREILRAAGWHDRKRPGHGDKLLDEIGERLTSLREFPRSGHPMSGAFRRKLLRKFPYSIIYLEQGDEVIVVALANYKRRADYWRRRLKSPDL